MWSEFCLPTTNVTGCSPSKTPLTVIDMSRSNTTSRFLHSAQVATEAVLSLDDNIVLTTDEIDFAFEVWKSFPESIVGFQARSHYWNDVKKLWVYTSASSNEYSMVLTSAAFLHRKYGKLYTESLPRSLASTSMSFKGLIPYH